MAAAYRNDVQRKSRSAARHLTRSELLASRRRGAKEHEQKLYGEYERDNVAALRQFTLETNRAGPQIFAATTSDVVVQDNTWTDRTLAERGPAEMQTLRNLKVKSKLDARAGHGLTKYPDNDLNFERYQHTYDPEATEANKRRDYPISLKYLKKPLVVSQSQLLLNRKKDHWEQSLASKKVVDEGAHKDEIVRLTEREAARTEFLHQRNSELLKKRGLTQTKTKRQLEAERQAQTAMEVAIKADVPRTGVHPMRLPLFSQSTPETPAEPDGRSKSQKLQAIQAVDRRKHWEFRAGYISKPT